MIDLGYEPENVQVILQGKDKLAYKLFLVNENGIISTFTHSREHEHASSEPTDTNVASKIGSALRESASGIERLERKLEMQLQEMTQINEQLHLGT